MKKRIGKDEIGEDIKSVGIGRKAIEKKRKKEEERPEKREKANENQEKGEQKPRCKRKRFMVIKSIYDARIAMQSLLNEIRHGEWEPDSAGRQIQCLQAIAEFFQKDNEKEIAKLYALAQARGLVPGNLK